MLFVIIFGFKREAKLHIRSLIIHCLKNKITITRIIYYRFRLLRVVRLQHDPRTFRVHLVPIRSTPASPRHRHTPDVRTFTTRFRITPIHELSERNGFLLLTNTTVTLDFISDGVHLCVNFDINVNLTVIWVKTLAFVYLSANNFFSVLISNL